MPGTYKETVTALILDDVNDGIIGTVTIQITAVKIEDTTATPSEKKPEPKAPMKRRFSNLLGVGVGESDSPRLSSDKRKRSIETLNRVSEVLRDSVKNIPIGGLQRRLSNVGLLPTEEPPPLPCVVTQGEHTHAPNEIDLDSHTAVAVAVSEGYAHLFRVPVSKLQEVESFFLMSLQTANHRINALPKKMVQKNR